MNTKYVIFDFYHRQMFYNILKNIKYTTCSKTQQKIKYTYLNLACSFDIETTSTYTKNGEKIGYMYLWQLGIDGYSIIGRNFHELREIMQDVSEIFRLNETRRLMLFVHNLEFEFQFIRKELEIDKVFASETRRPIYAIMRGFEFRCSYILTGKSLKELGKSLVKYKCSKMVGDLDYSLIHNPTTPLTRKEVKYAVNDVRVVMCYIQEQIELEGGKICKIPLTATGYVRREIKKAVHNNISDYFRIRNLRLTSDFYNVVTKAYAGGFTHCNIFKVAETLLNVTSYDFTSSYPTIILSEKMPISNAVKVKIKSMQEFNKYLDLYCCCFAIHLKNVKLRENVYDAPLSESKCKYDKQVETIIDNGRIRYIADCVTYWTEVDFKIMSKFYTFDFEVSEVYAMQKGYMPLSYILETLNYYQAKTTLKGVAGAENEYMRKKANLNSLYGMCVTNPVHEINDYDADAGKWLEATKPDILDTLDKYNDSKGRAVYYPWGVWISAFARRNVLLGVLEFGKDYIYSDTDSIKVVNAEAHKAFIEKYNKQITEKIKMCLAHYNLDYNLASPITQDGEKKPLGVWDFDGFYTRFKSLGAKRYIVEKINKKGEKEIEITVAGVNKKTGSKYLSSFQNPFKAFDYNLVFSPEHSGKLTHTYLDDEIKENITDYLGNTEEIDVKSGIHLEGATYEMSIKPEYERLQKAIGIAEVGGILKV